MLTTFSWQTFDISSGLPDGWQQELADAAAAADFREYPRTPILTRESAGVRSISRGRVHAADVRERLPWLYEFYYGYVLELARQASAEPVMAALDDRYGIVLNIQRGTRMRFECHVDSNPLTGLLFCTDHYAGAGGELVFAHDPAAEDTGAVERACSVIRPQAGHLIFFDGRRHPHYARPLTSESQLRIVAVMNFYTMSCPESTRPPELNRHLFQQTLTARDFNAGGCRSDAADRPPHHHLPRRHHRHRILWRGCPSHAADTTWLRHPRLMRGRGRGLRAGSGATAATAITPPRPARTRARTGRPESP